MKLNKRLKKRHLSDAELVVEPGKELNSLAKSVSISSTSSKSSIDTEINSSNKLLNPAKKWINKFEVK